ncbi:type II toxin-antitoxin system PemK/MazF family toxin [Pseudarthrobacter sp. NamB4]|uniref:type II toxin-antitoxin system PemK/MazF family toxin n=1 Tax=Pseudarthrobacter sp. NamB4 TaxID=2576837 RepID=UPI0010FD1C60|nr:type II toxin-antitoxin system PemK/MazF family toxin [Pseudarthrobacter sp. NamB4]TLM73503.1 type II toxin-antitoxin system PemK/MazF family toxin [Pseudarthrobacter sp. NamB4]
MAFNLRSLTSAVQAGLRLLQNSRPPAPGARQGARPDSHRVPGKTNGKASAGMPAAAPRSPGVDYPGDFRGRAAVRYAPQPDGNPDPGEVVWAWVPYEEDHTRGKDRPVLLVGRSGQYLLGLMLTSRDRVSASSSSGDYVDLGAGGWDRQNRPSEARIDRILQLREENIRREGAVLDPARFEDVAAGLRRLHGWT